MPIHLAPVLALSSRPISPDDYADTLAEDGDLVHYENLQFLHKENLEQLRDFGWLK